FDLDGFSEEWPLAAAEDREFCYRWLKRDYAMIFVPQARVYHRHALNLDSFCQLHFRYGRGAYEYHRLRAGGTGQGSLKPDWRFHWGCLCYPFRHMPPSQAIPTVALPAIWQAANAAGKFWQRVTAGTKEAKRRPAAGSL